MKQDEIVELFHRSELKLMNDPEKLHAINKFVLSDSDKDLYVLLCGVEIGNLENLEKKVFRNYYYDYKKIWYSLNTFVLANRKNSQYGVFMNDRSCGAYAVKDGVLTLKTQLKTYHWTESSILTVKLKGKPLEGFIGKISEENEVTRKNRHPNISDVCIWKIGEKINDQMLVHTVISLFYEKISALVSQYADPYG